MIRFAVLFTLLIISPLWAGDDDFIETDDSIELPKSVQMRRAPFSEELIQTITRKIEEKKDTLKKCNLWTLANHDDINIYPILMVLEKCPNLGEIEANQVNRKTALALSTLKIIADGPVSLGSLFDTHPRNTLCLSYDGYNYGIMCDVAQRCLCKYLGLTNPFDYHTKEFTDRIVANSDALEAFLTQCRAKESFLLSDPNFEAILAAER